MRDIKRIDMLLVDLAALVDWDESRQPSSDSLSGPVHQQHKVLVLDTISEMLLFPDNRSIRGDNNSPSLDV